MVEGKKEEGEEGGGGGVESGGERKDYRERYEREKVEAASLGKE
jgi:hypothetical protein